MVNALARLPVQWRVVYGLGHDRRNVYVAALRDLEADLIASGDHALVTPCTLRRIVHCRLIPGAYSKIRGTSHLTQINGS